MAAYFSAVLALTERRSAACHQSMCDHRGTNQSWMRKRSGNFFFCVYPSAFEKDFKWKVTNLAIFAVKLATQLFRCRLGSKCCQSINNQCFFYCKAPLSEVNYFRRKNYRREDAQGGTAQEGSGVFTRCQVLASPVTSDAPHCWTREVIKNVFVDWFVSTKKCVQNMGNFEHMWRGGNC